jgi:catechol 2,3-dioxygenase-like lactoylglutathione lyase family enzyme
MKPRMLTMLLMVATCSLAQTAKRPKITGIDHVDFYTTAKDGTDHLYATVLGLAKADPIEPGQTQRFVVGSQWVGYSSAPDTNTTNRMDHAAFRTDSAEGMRLYLKSKGVSVPDAVQEGKIGTSFTVKDPEGHVIEFAEAAKSATPEPGADAVSRRLIHVGFIVHDKPAEDHFYLDILGFRPYWHGGMKPEKTDWVAMQVPDGRDWLEYMLNIKPDADQHTVGVMNHISLGVVDMKQAQSKLESHGWAPHGEEHSQLGKDGKWQLNIYDPDQTRVELMEFKPAEKPCCSEFTGPHPSE